MTSSPQPLPSLPPSPVEAPRTLRNEEDVGRAWHDDEPSTSTRLKAARKGNGKRRGTGGQDDDDDEDEEEEDEDEENSRVAKGYPPTKEEEAESRRIEENLRRWEIAERQRRKAARESASHARTPSSTAANNSPSFFADLFRRDSRKAPLGGVGAHHVLSTRDRDTDNVPLEDLDTPSLDRFSPPPTPEPENPFDTPWVSRTSLNIPDNPAIMTESDSVPEDLVKGGGKKVPKRPTLEASSSFAGPDAPVKRAQSKRQPPPPKPLDLPAPRSPPPDPDAPLVERPPEPVMEPDAHERDGDVEAQRGRLRQVEEDVQPVRWWHEWLCGCGEGPDRGGDHQAGRTNPFE